MSPPPFVMTVGDTPPPPIDPPSGLYPRTVKHPRHLAPVALLHRPKHCNGSRSSPRGPPPPPVYPVFKARLFPVHLAVDAYRPVRFHIPKVSSAPCPPPGRWLSSARGFRCPTHFRRSRSPGLHRRCCQSCSACPSSSYTSIRKWSHDAETRVVTVKDTSPVRTWLLYPSSRYRPP